MNTNRLICRNEVIVEGRSIGSFESFECKADSRTLGNTGVLTIPLYAIGRDGSKGRARARTRATFVTTKTIETVNEKNETVVVTSETSQIRPCAQVEVWCWYDSWNARTNEMESHEKILVFAGFVEHVVEGFPTKVYLQDNAFILRFGNIQKIWNENATLQQIVSDCIPIAQDGFTKERKKLGFTRPIPELRYSVEDKNVQAVTTSLSFRNWSGRSPYDTVQKLMQLLVLYGGVSRDYNVFIGAGVTKSDRPQIELDTRYNVIERDITPVDGRFVDYEVKVVGILKDGTKWTATGGYGTSRSKTSQSEFEVTYGQVERYYAPHNTREGIQNFADQMLAKLRGLRNRGSVTTLLYPKLDIMDWVRYKDTVFPILDGGYYVLDYQFKADEEGYFQRISLTDQVFSI